MRPIGLLAFLSVLSLIALAVIYFYVNSVVSTGMPSLEQLENPQQNQATRVYSSDGELLDFFYKQRRIAVPYDSIPKNFINALVATEDKKYWNHWGVHLRRIFNAAVKNVLAMRRKEGASTITMQVARSLFLNRDYTIDRKIREAVTAIQIERIYTKEEILELYANTVIFGRGAYGLQVAADMYFNKSPIDLSISECAFLVGLLKNPEHYNALANYERSLQRRNLVLSLMYEQDYLSPAEYRKALKEPIKLYANTKEALAQRYKNQIAPHYVENIRRMLSKNRDYIQHFDLYADGLNIHTTLNARVQKRLNQAVEEYLTEFQEDFEKSWNWNYHKDLLKTLVSETIKARPDYKSASKSEKKKLLRELQNNKKFVDSIKNRATTIQCAVTIIDPSSGSIVGMVGASPKFMKEDPTSQYSLNHATQITRQPGSAFKPFVYASALQKGITPETQIECGPYSFKMSNGQTWSPRGTGNCEPGETKSLTYCLQLSINTVSARLVTQVTNPSDVASLAYKMGIKSNLRAVPAISLGAGGEITPLEITSAFGTFAYNGLHVEPYYVDYIEDPYGNLVYENKARTVTDALEKEIAIQMIYMMERVISGGTATRVRNNFRGVDCAGKTGTTNESRDLLFIGYTPQLVCGIWFGFDDQRINFKSMGGRAYGGRAAAPLWGLIMDKIYKDANIDYHQKHFNYKSNIDTLGPVYPLTPLQQNSSRSVIKNAKDSEKENKDKDQQKPILPPLPRRIPF